VPESGLFAVHLTRLLSHYAPITARLEARFGRLGCGGSALANGPTRASRGSRARRTEIGFFVQVLLCDPAQLLAHLDRIVDLSAM